MSEYAGQQFVGIDLHRRRSVIVRTTESGEVLESVRILNDVEGLDRVAPLRLRIRAVRSRESDKRRTSEARATGAGGQGFESPQLRRTHIPSP